MRTLTPPLPRRTILRAGGVALALPLLQAMQPRRAAAATLPKRFIGLFSGNGTIRSNWTPQGTETAFTLSPILAPLERWKSRLVVLDGVDQQGGGINNGHEDGINGFLTGQPMFRRPDGKWGFAAGISLDQQIAGTVGGTTKFRSLELGVNCEGYAGRRMCFSGADAPISPEQSPARAFARLFADVGDGSAPAIERLRAQRKSVMDAVLDQYRAVGRRLGADDARRLDSHAAVIRELERQLATMPPTAACAVPTAAELVPKTTGFPELVRAQMNILALALSCDLTRVATLQMSRSASNEVFRWIGITREHHAISHEPDTDPVAVDQMTRINAWYAEQIAYLAGRLQQLPEGSGTLLDGVVMLWGNELGAGNRHARNDAPYVVLGSARGAIRTGRFLKYDRVPHNNLLVSLANAMDVPIETFGKPEWCTGPLSGF